MPRILIVDDDRDTCRFMADLLDRPDREIQSAYDPGTALALVRDQVFDLVISDINLNAAQSGLDILRAFRQSSPRGHVLLISGFGTLETAIDAVRAGAFDYISKPFDIGEVKATVERALAQAGTPPGEPAAPARPVRPAELLGRTAPMLAVYKQIAHAADAVAPVLIVGESGTGKELVARQLHDLGHRRRGPFVAVNCAAIVESLLEAELFGIEDRTATGVRGRRGKFELADGGTLFLDEVSDLTPAAQAKLLRAIQELSVERVGGHGVRKVDARIVVATNKSLRDLVAAGQFRPDLFYRLSGVELHVPPLRARRQDIPDLCAFFLSRYQTPRPVSLSPEVLQALQLYDWPGNVRELERMIEGAVALASNGRIALGDLPPSLRGDTVGALQEALQREDTMRAWGARYARLVLERCRGNKRRACDALDISYHTLMAYLRWRPSRPSGEASAGDAPARDRVAPPDGTSSADRAVFG
jgi:DNA-binding NtrC family response regulator